MAIKESGGRGSKADEISQVIGSDAHYLRYYFDELKLICLGPHSRDLVGVSRFYPMLEQQVDPTDNTKLLPKRTPVVVDFEPRKEEGKFYLEEKRKFFMEKNIIYIPIYLYEQLTKEEFAARFEQERQNLIQGFREAMEDAALDMDKVEVPMFTDENFIAQAKAEALERVTKMGLRGAAKNKRLARELEAILKEKTDVLAAGRRNQSIPGAVGGPVNR